MIAKRYLFAAAFGLLAGGIWGMVGGFPPDWYDRLMPWQQTTICVAPLAVSLIFALLLQWWDWKAYAICSIMWGIAMDVVGDYADRLYGCGCGEPWWYPSVIIAAFGYVAAINAVAWALGRSLRKMLINVRFRRNAES